MNENNSQNKNENAKKLSDNVVLRVVGGVDKPLLITIIILLCLGSIMVLSASFVHAGEYNGDSYYYAKRQLLFVAIGLALMFLISRYLDYNLLRRLSKPIFVFSTLLLAAVLVIGTSGNGAQRWIYIGPISIQPSEITKFAVVLICADYITKYNEKIRLPGIRGSMWKIAFPFLIILGLGGVLAAAPIILPKLIGKSNEGEAPSAAEIIAGFFKDNLLAFVIVGAILIAIAVWFAYRCRINKTAPDFFYGVLPFIVMLLVTGGLLIAQPHLSGFIIIATITVIMMIVGGTSGKYIGVFSLIGGAGLLAVARLLPHAAKRLAVWKNPFDPNYISGDGWQPAQSLYAIGSGGIWGVGLGNSRQKHLYLPEPHNDYIFAVLCEELGFIGAVAVICLFVFFVYRGIVIALRAPDRFSSLIVIGIISHVGLQALLNMLVVTNTLPSTGISLPFFSYGGSSLIILLAEMGVVLAISRYSVIDKK